MLCRLKGVERKLQDFREQIPDPTGVHESEWLWWCTYMGVIRSGSKRDNPSG